MIARALLGLALLLLPAAALGQHAHEHGVATLKVALDGRKLVVELESPLDNLVGFEHAPRNDRQRAALKKMEASLEAGDRLLRPSAAAACTLRGITIEHPYRATAAAGPAPADSARTKASEARGKGPGPAETHAELSATYELECAKPEALDRIDVLFFDAFPGMKRLKAQTASPRGQSSKALTARSRSLSF